MINKLRHIKSIDDYFGHVRIHKDIYTCNQCKEKVPVKNKQEHMYYAHTHTRYYYNAGYNSC